jgi:hypothetical protein
LPKSLLVGSVILSGAKNPILDAETLRFVQESTSKPQGRGRVAANAGVLGGNGGGVEVDATGGKGKADSVSHKKIPLLRK